MTNHELKQAMDQYGLSKEQVAQITGSSVAAVYRWLDGTRRIRGPVAKLIANHVGESK